MKTLEAPRIRALACALAALTVIVGCSGGDPAPAPRESEDPGAAVPRDVGAAGVTPGVATGAAPPAAIRLRQAFPEARVLFRDTTVQRIYGVVARGISPDAAAESFRQKGVEALGVQPEDLVPAPGFPALGLSGSRVLDAQRGQPVTSADPDADARGLGLMFDPDTGDYKYRLYAYRQQRHGVVVFGGELRTLVRVGEDNPVVWVNADLRPLGDFTPPTSLHTPWVDEDKALASLRGGAPLGGTHSAPRALTNFGAPSLVIFAGVGQQRVAPRMAMEFTAEELDGPRSWSFVADVATGDVLHVESNVHFDIQGTVEAEVATGLSALECSPLGIEPLAYASVSSPVGDAVADRNGAFTIAESGSGPVTVTSSIVGEYFQVVDVSGTTNTLSLEVTPPGPANFLHQDPMTPPELVLAQLSAYKHANDIRDMLLQHVPDYPIIADEKSFLINVNREGNHPMDTCFGTGGWYDGDRKPASINFCQRNDNHVNAAFGSIVHHEFGHHIIDMGLSGQAQYGEGMADTIAMLYAKDPRIGIGYNFDCGEPLRNADRHCDYDPDDCSSCGAGIYDCGALLSGTIWDIWQLLEATEPDADEIIRSLVFASIPMHSGIGIDPSIAIDLLTLDDDDGLLENGTPHYAEICQGFAMHAMSCPPLEDGLVVQGASYETQGPSDGPFEPASFEYTLHNLGPQSTLAYSVSVTPAVSWLTVDSTAGSIPLAGQASVSVSIDQAEAALLSDGRYSATIEFVDQAPGGKTVTRDVNLRVGVPDALQTFSFDDGLQGFVVDDEVENIWHWSTSCADDLPGHSAPGSLYYGREAQCDHSTGAPNRHTVTSPEIAIENSSIVDLGFAYTLETERHGTDLLEVLVSVNDGPFQVVASNGDQGVFIDETRAWEDLRFELSDLMPGGPASIRLQFAFDAGSPGDNYRPGFAVDDVTVYANPPSASQAVLVPALIEAEDYVRYFDTTPGNQGGGCDTGDDVDKEPTEDSVGGGCNVGWIDAGEWLEYDITVSSPRTFDIVTRVAAQNAGKSFRIEIDGVDVSGTLSVPASGWQSYSDVVAPGVSLSAGEHVVRVVMLTNYMNINYLDFQPAGGGPSCGNGICDAEEDCLSCAQDCSCAGVSLPALIEAEDYVRYFDTTPGNEGGACDTGDDVDKELTGDTAGGGCNVGWIDAGEWLEYDITVSSPQTFDIVTRVAAQNAGKSFRIEIDGVDVTGALSVPASGWQSYSDVVAPGISLSAGEHVVRVVMLTNYMNINYLDFQLTGSGPSCGDDLCDATEDCLSCAQDCGECPGSCTCPSGCDAVQNASVPFSRDGVVDACYFLSGGAGSYLNSWNMEQVTLNGTEATNVWLGSGSYPALIDGGYYLYLRGDFAWSHVEVN